MSKKCHLLGTSYLLKDFEPDPVKIEAIIKMDEPEDAPGVQRIVGMVKYLSKFLQGLSDMC